MKIWRYLRMSTSYWCLFVLKILENYHHNWPRQSAMLCNPSMSFQSRHPKWNLVPYFFLHRHTSLPKWSATDKVKQQSAIKCEILKLKNTFIEPNCYNLLLISSNYECGKFKVVASVKWKCGIFGVCVQLRIKSLVQRKEYSHKIQICIWIIIYNF